MTKQNRVQPMTTSKFTVDAHDLSNIMDPKANREFFDKCGGTEAIAKLLHTDLSKGLTGDPADLAERVAYFGGNYFAEKKLPSYISLVFDSLQDTTIIMLIICASIGLILDLTISTDHEGSVPGWVEPLAIIITVLIVVNVTATIDYQKEILFAALNKQLEKTNIRQVIRNGKIVEVNDRDIVVGDLLVFNNVLQSSLPADGLFASGDNVKMDQASLTGEIEPQKKIFEFRSEKQNPLMFSGTEV